MSGRQRGAAAVEFALIMLVFFALFFGIVEFGRLLFLWDTAQEVTRHAARDAVVSLGGRDNNSGRLNSEIRRNAIFQPVTPQAPLGSVFSVPGAWELTNASISIKYYYSYSDAAANNNKDVAAPETAEEICDYVADCLPDDANCYINFIRASVSGVQYDPMVFRGGGTISPFNLDLRINLPTSTVIMPVESLGYVPETCTGG